MNKTKQFETTPASITVTSEGLRELLQCGKRAALEIGTLAGAKVKFGKRVLWNVKKVQEYIDSISK